MFVALDDELCVGDDGALDDHVIVGIEADISEVTGLPKHAERLLETVHQREFGVACEVPSMSSAGKRGTSAPRSLGGCFLMYGHDTAETGDVSYTFGTYSCEMSL
jgi:hypothetical protein